MSKQLIIAEIGINHLGNVRLAYDLINEAKSAGADAVKFQTFWNIKLGWPYELKDDDFIKLRDYCELRDIKFMSTPHTFEAIHFLDELVGVYKIASTYLPNINFLKEVASKNKPILLSTGSLIHNNGMCTIEEIRNALSYIPDSDITLMHCVSKYPCTNPHYERIDKLKELGYPVGLSDHSKTIKVPKGLPVYEKHFMLDDIDCPDSNVSLTMNEFKEMVDWLRSS